MLDRNDALDSLLGGSIVMRHFYSNILGITLCFALILLAGCGRRQLSGTIQSSTLVKNGSQISFGTSDSSDYIFVETKALVGAEGATFLYGQNDTNTLFRLGSQYIGRQIRVSGHIQRDQTGRRFIDVTDRKQIELLR